MTKEEIYNKRLNERVKVESNKVIDHDHYLAIMDAMEEYRNQDTNSNPSYLSLEERIKMVPDTNALNI